jgi:hypothetical protein
VDVKLDDVLPGHGSRAVHRERKAAVDDGALDVDDLAIGRDPVVERATGAKDAPGDRPRVGPAASNDRDRPAPRRGRDRRDRIVELRYGALSFG